MGEKEIKEWEKTMQKSKKEEGEQEAEIKRKIYEIRKEKIKSRRSGENDTLPPKRRKLDSEWVIRVKKDPREHPVKEKRPAGKEQEKKEQPEAKRRK